MLTKRDVLLHTSAEVEEVTALLSQSTEPGAPVSLAGAVKDTFRKDSKPFRGEVVGATFKLARRVGGRRARVVVSGTVRPVAGGGSELHATISPPPIMAPALLGGAFGLAAGLTAFAVLGVPLLPIAAMLGLGAVAVVVNARFFQAEVSATFHALRVAVPEQVGSGEGARVPAAQRQLA